VDYLISFNNNYYLTDDTTRFGKRCKINFPNHLELFQPSTVSTVSANGTLINNVYQTGIKGKNFSLTIDFWYKNHWSTLKTILDNLATKSVLFTCVLVFERFTGGGANLVIIRENVRGFYNPTIYNSTGFNYSFIENLTINLIGT
jgi:hypothetical protein